ncbi:hypothetical protein G6F42_022876 [Rhizopus arrhizus]|nr:hypothetical protein G6F42_022876 [Rhizopus arrhizus]
MIDNLPISVDKVIKHSSLFTLSKPNPSEADVMIKIWADLFEALLKIINMQIMDIIRQTLNNKKKKKKSMKRKIQEEIGYDEVTPSLKAKLAPTWRYKAKSEIE